MIVVQVVVRKKKLLEPLVREREVFVAFALVGIVLGHATATRCKQENDGRSGSERQRKLR